MALADINIEERKKWDLRTGNTVRVWQKIREGEKTRLQAFEGLIIAHKHGLESGATFTVRKNSGGIGVERIFPVFSPNIDRIEIVKRSKVRRSKLYYIREKTTKQIRKKMKQLRNVFSDKDGNNVREEKSVESAEKAQTENKEKTPVDDAVGGTGSVGEEKREDVSEENDEVLKERKNKDTEEEKKPKEEDKKEN